MKQFSFARYKLLSVTLRAICVENIVYVKPKVGVVVIDYRYRSNDRLLFALLTILFMCGRSILHCVNVFMFVWLPEFNKTCMYLRSCNVI